MYSIKIEEIDGVEHRKVFADDVLICEMKLEDGKVMHRAMPIENEKHYRLIAETAELVRVGFVRQHVPQDEQE